MNFLKRITKNIAENKKLQERLNNQLSGTYHYLTQSCSCLDKILKNIHAMSDISTSNEETKLNEKLHTNRILNNINDFGYNFSEYADELEGLKVLVADAKLNKKQTKLYNLLTEAKEKQIHNFLETYSRFLVKCQIHHTHKKQIKDKFIEVINKLEIPLHTENLNEIKNK